MKNSTLTLIFSIAFILIVSSCAEKKNHPFSFAFYNVENLFDTIDSKDVNDASYLPTSKVSWNTKRYNHKLDNISRVMMSMDSAELPALFGLCEVENLSVIEDLVQHPNLISAGYIIIHKNSPDERGIDVALLYNPKVYKPVSNKFIKPNIKSDTDILTRDILYSKGLVNTKDTIHLFINHWVSRWGGQEETEPHRIEIAKTILHITDSILRIIPNANILIAGDLNDNPTDTSIYNVLNAKEIQPSISENDLYNLSIKQYKDGIGSLYYNSWDMFDQIIVSGALINGKNGLKIMSPDQIVFKEDWMLYKPKKGEPRPSRTASGKNYYGGYSDHLPVMVNIDSDY